MTSKVCTLCGQLTDLSDFYGNKTARDGGQDVCKACNLALDLIECSDPEEMNIDLLHDLFTGRKTVRSHVKELK